MNVTLKEAEKGFLEKHDIPIILRRLPMGAFQLGDFELLQLQHCVHDTLGFLLIFIKLVL